MENKYQIFLDLDNLTKDVYLKSFMADDYEVIVDENNILFVKKINNKNINLLHEKIVLEVAISIARKYIGNGFIHIDISKEVNDILARIKDENKVKGTDNRITWPLRQAITNAIILKNKNEMK